MTELGECYRQFARIGVDLKVVYDIGAHKGTWATDVKANALPDADFYLFEANQVWARDLARTGLRSIIVCLTGPDNEGVEFWNGENSGASYYKENTGFYEEQGSIMLPAYSLNEVMTSYDLPPPDLIKLDTQGSELDILMGASRALSQAKVIQCEVPLIPYNRGAPDAGAYLAFFRQRDFAPIAVIGTQALEGVLVHQDLLFIRKDVKERAFPSTKLRYWK